MIKLHKGDTRHYYCKNCKSIPKSVYQAEDMPNNLLFCSGCWKGPVVTTFPSYAVEKSMRYFLRCQCGADGVGYGHREIGDDTDTYVVQEIEWEGGINDDFDPLIDNKDNLCKHEDYEIEDSEDDRDYDDGDQGYVHTHW